MVKDGMISGGKFVLDMPTLVSLKDDEGSNGKLTGHLKSPDFLMLQPTQNPLLK